jgi:hypothetical protein
MEYACGLPFALTIAIVGGVWLLETGQAMQRHLAARKRALEKKALQGSASSLRSGAYEMLNARMTVPPGRA